jgi:hypothetical protein
VKIEEKRKEENRSKPVPLVVIALFSSFLATGSEKVDLRFVAVHLRAQRFQAKPYTIQQLSEAAQSVLAGSGTM